jgi:hypothetical protein
MHRLADGVDPDIIATAQAAASSVPGGIHAHARAGWTGRTLRVELEGWVDPELPVKDADAFGRLWQTSSPASSPTQTASPGPREQRQPDHQDGAGSVVEQAKIAVP